MQKGKVIHLQTESKRRKEMKRKKVLGLLLTGIIILSGCTSKQATPPPTAIGVRVMTVSTSDDALSATYVGTVEESYGSELSFATMGTVSTVLADQGAAVRSGQVLARLDESTLRNAYDIACSTLAQTRDAFRRMDMLYKKGSLAEIKYIEIQTQLSQAEAAERIARKNLSDCVLRAPFDGYISQRSVDAGNNVVPGSSCFKLVKIGSVKIKMSIPEKEIAGIRIGQPIHFTVSALGDRSFVATVKEKGVQANALSHTYEVKAELGNTDRALLPGMVANVSIDRQGAANAIVVPQDAVLVDGQGTYVWIADGNVCHRRDVTAGDANNKGIIINGGLHQGEQIIISGQNKVSEGSKIEKK